MWQSDRVTHLEGEGGSRASEPRVGEPHLHTSKTHTHPTPTSNIEQRGDTIAAQTAPDVRCPQHPCAACCTWCRTHYINQTGTDTCCTPMHKRELHPVACMHTYTHAFKHPSMHTYIQCTFAALLSHGAPTPRVTHQPQTLSRSPHGPRCPPRQSHGWRRRTHPDQPLHASTCLAGQHLGHRCNNNSKNIGMNTTGIKHNATQQKESKQQQQHRMTPPTLGRPPSNTG